MTDDNATIDAALRPALQRSDAGGSECSASDHAIAQAVQGRFDASSHFALRSIVGEFHEGVIVLRGRVASFYHKQMAQEMVRSIDGIGEIINVVEVIQGLSVSTWEAAARNRSVTSVRNRANDR